MSDMLLPSEKDDRGDPLPGCSKANQTVWEAHHDGNPFEGPIKPFGCLVWYWYKDAHPLMPTSENGIFLGWVIEPGVIYRRQLKIAPYDKLREGTFRRDQAVSVHESEVVWPEENIFPFAAAKDKALLEGSAVQVTSRHPSKHAQSGCGWGPLTV